MVELKGHQPYETEGKLCFHSCLTLTRFESSQLEGSYVGDSMYLIPVSCMATSQLPHPPVSPTQDWCSLGWVSCALCQHRLLVAHAGNWNRGRGEPLLALVLGGLPYKPVFNCLEVCTLGQRARNSLCSLLS